MFSIGSESDYSNEFASLRSQLINSVGVRYADYVRTLRQPRYVRVYSDLIAGHVALALIVAGLCLSEARGVTPFLTIPVGAILIGFTAVFIGSFVHEGAHYNLAKGRRANDILGTVAVGWLLALDIKSYRIVHFEHHRSLGTTRDSEFSYFSALNLYFFLERLFGLRTITTLISYANKANRPANGGSKRKIGIAALLPLLYAACVNVAIVVVLFVSGYFWAAATWVVGIGIMLPLLASMRQLLEHRSDKADNAVDYGKFDQGAYTRLFGSGIFATLFGSAGFNRHLLHHWEPGISYTRMRELEDFLADTQMREVMDRRRFSYAGAFGRLFAWR